MSGGRDTSGKARWGIGYRNSVPETAKGMLPKERRQRERKVSLDQHRLAFSGWLTS